MLASSGSAAYSWVGAVGGILGIVGLVGAAIAFLRASIGRETIRLLQDNNAALKEQNEQQAKEIDHLKARGADQERKIREQGQQIATLIERVDAKAELAQMNGKLDRVLVALEAK